MKSNRKPFLLWVNKYLQETYGVNANKFNQYNVCQRLDINTSGGVLVAIHNNMYKQCRAIINDKKNMMKLYICLTNGEIKLKKH